MDITSDEIIKILDLKPLPYEGGFYRETYRSPDFIESSVLSDRHNEPRSLCTQIYYLLVPGTVSTLHRLKSDEMFHFYMGDPVTMLRLLDDGSYDLIVLGQNIRESEHLQVLVPHGTWFGLFLNDGGQFGLMGTTVSPGFEFSDFESGNREKLSKAYPRVRDLIHRLT